MFNYGKHLNCSWPESVSAGPAHTVIEEAALEQPQSERFGWLRAVNAAHFVHRCRQRIEARLAGLEQVSAESDSRSEEPELIESRRLRWAQIQM